jgi:signal transduction histidine kinase
MFHEPSPLSSRRSGASTSNDVLDKVMMASVDAASVGVAVLEGSRVLRANGALSELCGEIPLEVGRILERLDEEARDALSGALTRERRGRPERVEGSWTRLDGTRVAVEIVVVGAEVEGRPACSLVVRALPRMASGVRARAITPPLRLEVQHDLVVSASHALRTPLTALVLHLQCMRRALDRPELNKGAIVRRVEKALLHTEQLTLQVNHLLDASGAAK